MFPVPLFENGKSWDSRVGVRRTKPEGKVEPKEVTQKK
jgi:hypothetical protein